MSAFERTAVQCIIDKATAAGIPVPGGVVKHHPMICRAGRYGFWATCWCGAWRGRCWTTCSGAHLEFGRHLLAAARAGRAA